MSIDEPLVLKNVYRILEMTFNDTFPAPKVSFSLKTFSREINKENFLGVWQNEKSCDVNHIPVLGFWLCNHPLLLLHYLVWMVYFCKKKLDTIFELWQITFQFEQCWPDTTDLSNTVSDSQLGSETNKVDHPFWPTSSEFRP